MNIQKLRVRVVFFMSFIMIDIAYVIDRAVRWSKHLDGFCTGVFEIPIIDFTWSIIILPWFCVVIVLYKLCNWNRFETTWLIAPSLSISCFYICGLIIDPATESERFKVSTGNSLPASASVVSNDYSKTLLGKASDTFFFFCSMTDTDALISTMQLEKEIGFQCPSSYIPIALLLGTPDYHGWAGLQCYKGNTNGRFCQLLTDGAHEKVYINFR